MQRPGPPPIRIERLASGEDARAWEAALGALDLRRGTLLKDHAGTAVFRGIILGRDTVLKRWDLSSFGARARATLGLGPADRHWRGAAWLQRVGVPTGRCLALATERRGPCPRRWLAMEAVPGRTLLEAIAGDLPIRDQHAIARAVGSQIDVFLSHLRSNRDHKPSNLIVTGDPGAPEIAIIDCVGLRRLSNPEGMLASLLIEPLGCGLRVRRTIRMRVLSSYLHAAAAAVGLSRDQRREQRDFLWREVGERIDAHGDPRPRVDPLARPEARP